MKRFRVDLRGENLLLNLDGEPRKFGFRFCKYLYAVDEETAEKTAGILVRQLPALKQGLCNTTEDPLRVHLEGLCVVNVFQFALCHKRTRFELLVEEDPE